MCLFSGEFESLNHH